MHLLSDDVMKSFCVRKLVTSYTPNSDKRIWSLKFSSDGEKLLSSSNQNAIEIYDCDTTRQNVIPLRRHGSGFCDFSADNGMVLITSTRGDHAVRELSIEKYEYSKLFFGHTDRVTSMAVNLKDNTFLTGARDRSVLLWDIRTQSPQGTKKDLEDTPLVSWSPCGQMFSIAMETRENRMVCFYDLRGIDNGPFVTHKFNKDMMVWKSVKFSPDGKSILISTNSTKVRLIDSYTGKTIRQFGSRKNDIAIPIDASFTPDSDYILTGSSNGNLNIYSLNCNRIGHSEEGLKIAEISSNENEAITEVELNPKYSMIVTASSFVGFWIPNLNR